MGAAGDLPGPVVEVQVRPSRPLRPAGAAGTPSVRTHAFGPCWTVSGLAAADAAGGARTPVATRPTATAAAAGTPLMRGGAFREGPT